MEYNIKTTREDFYFKYLSAINGVLGLSKKEILILGEFIKLTTQYEDSEVVFSTLMRKRVRDKLGMSPHNFNNYFKTLKEKYAILENTLGKMYINPRIVPTIKAGVNSVVFNFHVYEQKTNNTASRQEVQSTRAYSGENR